MIRQEMGTKTRVHPQVLKRLFFTSIMNQLVSNILKAQGTFPQKLTMLLSGKAVVRRREIKKRILTWGEILTQASHLNG